MPFLYNQVYILFLDMVIYMSYTYLNVSTKFKITISWMDSLTWI